MNVKPVFERFSSCIIEWNNSLSRTLPAHTSGLVGYTTKEDVEKTPMNVESFTVHHEIPVSELRPAWELHMELLPYTSAKLNV